MARSSGNSWAAMMVVGLGMVLIAGLSGIVFYMVTHRKALTNRGSDVPTPNVEPAEA